MVVEVVLVEEVVGFEQSQASFCWIMSTGMILYDTVCLYYEIKELAVSISNVIQIPLFLFLFIHHSCCHDSVIDIFSSICKTSDII